MPVALSIAGSDSGGGAGIQADLLTFAANGVFGTTALTCVTAQNPDAVSAVAALPVDLVMAQIEAVVRYFPLRACKTGMLFNRSIIAGVAAVVRRNKQIPVVVDPVMVASSGAVLLEEEAIEVLAAELLPQAALITPNLDEALVLVGEKPSGHPLKADARQQVELVQELCRRFGTACLLKGGHSEDSEVVVDRLALPGGSLHSFAHPRALSLHTHGSGCSLASAVTAGLARGFSLLTSVERGITYLQDGIRHPLRLGNEHFINHFPESPKRLRPPDRV